MRRLVLLALIFVSLLVGSPSRALAETEIELGNPFRLGETDKKAAPTVPTNPFNENLATDVAAGLPDKLKRSYTENPILLVVQIIRILLSFVGIGLVGLLVYAGFLWMTAAGNDEQVGTAKTTIKNAVIGLIIILASWSLSTYIIRRIQVATKSYGGSSLPATGSFLEQNTGGFVGPGGLIR